MRNSAFQNEIKTLLPHIMVKFQEPMSKHTSFRIGGPASVMVFPQNADELADILKVSKLLDCKLAILGAGTNILAPDEGIDGIVVCLKDCMSGMKQLDETHIWVASGVTMARAAVFAAGLGLGGMEFAHGIPGSVGGGVYMNAGAYGGEISQICYSVDVMNLDGSRKTILGKDMQFSYRHSVLEDEPGIVLGAVFSLEKRAEEEIRQKMTELMSRRKQSQPLDKPSAGSAFKRPAGAYAAALIEQNGLKGFSVGGAAVSDKHCGFVVNIGNAAAKDVKQLLQQVSEKVYEETGIRLEPEIRIW